jgi:Flp pilus assembly protein TadD
VHYNLGLALQQLGRRKPAETALLKAQSLDPLDPEVVHALVIFYAQGQQQKQAQQWAEKLQVLAANNPHAGQLLESLRNGH